MRCWQVKRWIFTLILAIDLIQSFSFVERKWVKISIINNFNDNAKKQVEVSVILEIPSTEKRHRGAHQRRGRHNFRTSGTFCLCVHKKTYFC